jgi:hypothetical protein
MKRSMALLGLVLVAGSVTAQDYFYPGDRVMEMCNNTGVGEPRVDLAQYLQCIGYLAGIADADQAHAKVRLAARTVCFPEGVTIEQLRQGYLRHMENPPDERQQPAASNTLEAIRAAWPCKG